MPISEIITIGTEILLGDIVDTNAAFLARALRDAGIDLYRKTTVGDNVQRIAQAIQQSLERSDIILTTGGLGPTVDDPTREAVALAMGVENEFRPELWDQIQERFSRYNRQPTENNKRQAFVPKGAIVIENPVGTAPAFVVEHANKAILSLPGVPREMEYLVEHAVIPYLRQRYQLKGIIKSRIIHTAGVGESMIDELIADLETYSNPTVGMAAHSGQVDVRVTAKAESEDQAELLIQPIEAAIRQRLGDWIYGVDGETLEEVALRNIQRRGWKLVVVEAGLGGLLIRRLAGVDGPFVGGEMLAEGDGMPDPDELLSAVDAFRQSRNADVGLGATIQPSGRQQNVSIVVITPAEVQRWVRPYGGPAEYAPRWALNHSLDIIRKL